MREALVPQACAGDVESFSRLTERLCDRICGVGARLLNHATAAKDLAQGVCIGLVSRPASFHGGGFTVWLYRVVANVVLSAVRGDGILELSERDYAKTSALAHDGRSASSESFSARGSRRRT